MSDSGKYKFYFVSLGCDKNLVDSERMLASLAAHGFVLTDDEEEADIAVVNTCCFIEDAKKESIEKIFDLARLKETARLKVLVAAGCMAQRYSEEILAEIPEIDAIIGTTGIDAVTEAVDEALLGRRTAAVRDPSRDPAVSSKGRMISTGGHYAYLKIAEGCDKRCTYCAIPDFRGHYRSFSIESLIEEAEELARGGVKELILVAQETTLYGTDLYGKKCLHDLLRRLCRIESLKWIRLLYCYPEEIYPELIDVMAEEEKICHYLDLPIQHASDAVLKRMNRRTTRADLTELIGTLRARIPDIVLRTTLITGFPGETEADHAEVLDFVREIQFDRLGVFMYSKEEGTPAALMKPQITKKVKKSRMDEIMRLQQGISLAKNVSRIGKVTDAFVEGKIPEEGVYIARTRGDAPQVDGFLFFESPRELMSGDLVRVKIVSASEYDLKGEVIDGCD